MSNKKLLEATIPEHQGPLFPESISKIQDAYKESRYGHLPINEKFLQHLTLEFKVFLIPRTKFYPHFVTEDGTAWHAIRVAFGGDNYRILFPKDRDRKHEDGTVSAHHVALYTDSDGEIPMLAAEKVGQAIYSVFEMARKDFRHAPK